LGDRIIAYSTPIFAHFALFAAGFPMEFGALLIEGMMVSERGCPASPLRNHHSWILPYGIWHD
jgi:hypothetical protein